MRTLRKVVLYSTGCPRCKVLEKKLQQKKIDYEEINDIKIMEDKGYINIPVLEVDDKIMNFKEAVDWTNKN